MSAAYHIKDREAFCAKRKAIAADPAVRAKQSVASKAAWDARRASTTWQPISTAPKDGTPILLFTDSLDAPFEIGSWIEADPTDADGLVGTWCDSGATPTHWMPLPKPPSVED